jgi:hypothetical protein
LLFYNVTVLKIIPPLSVIAAIALGVSLAACTSPPSISRTSPDPTDTHAWTLASTTEGATALGEWEHYELPAKKATLYTAQHLQGRHTMKAQAQSSASMLRRIEPQALGKLHFSWQVHALIADSNMVASATDDSPVRIVLAFEGDRRKFSMRNAMLSDLAHALTGEPLPYATLMYSWCAHCTPGQVIHNPRTDRIRTLVVETGRDSLEHWKDYERNIQADFQTVFGEAPGALVTIGVMTDADNTSSHATAWYGPIQLHSIAATR